jgi:hypothetical protein
MPRAIDHIVIASRDLAAQADLYRRLGFQVGARNRHPWGTENHIIQFDGAFLELIALGDGFEPPKPAKGEYSFAGFLARFLERRQGLAMLVLRSSDAEADRREFAAGGLGDFPRFDFARKARRPDGETVDVAFSLAFAASQAWPETGFFVCQQHFPQNFWSRTAQIHPNGAVGISGVAFAHEAPVEAAGFLAPFAAASGPRRAGQGLEIDAAGSTIEVAPRSVLREKYGAATMELDDPPFALVRIQVVNVDKTSAILSENGIAYRARGEALVVNADDALGAAIVFEA